MSLMTLIMIRQHYQLQSRIRSGDLVVNSFRLKVFGKLYFFISISHLIKLASINLRS